MPFFRNLKLAPRLVLMCLAFGLVPALGVFGAFEFSKGELKNEVRASLEQVASGTVDVIDRNLYERYGDVQAFTLNTAASDVPTGATLPKAIRWSVP